jgi:hypothetical protein
MVPPWNPLSAYLVPFTGEPFIRRSAQVSFTASWIVYIYTMGAFEKQASLK